MAVLNGLCNANDVDGKTTQEILRITQTVVNQNYFQFQDTIYIQNEGLAVGAPTSFILSEVYLQYMQNTTIHELLKKHRIEGYFRYVDDSLVVYNDDNTNIYNVLEDFNNLATKLKFSGHQVLPKQARYIQANPQKQKERERNYMTDPG